MSFISSVPPNGVVSGPLSNNLPLTVAQAAGAAGASPTGKLLLPNAVTASVLVPSYQEAPKPSQASKAALKLVTNNQPSSSLAAQLFAQSPEISNEEMELFVRRDPLPQQEIAQADLPPETPQPQALPTAVAQPSAPAAAATQPTTAATVTTTVAATLATATAQPAAATAKPAVNEERPVATPVSGAKRSTNANARASYQYVVDAAKWHFTPRAVEAVG